MLMWHLLKTNLEFLEAPCNLLYSLFYIQYKIRYNVSAVFKSNISEFR